MVIEKLEDPLKYYLQYAVDGKESWVSNGMRGLIPNSIIDTINKAKKNFGSNIIDTKKQDKREILGKIFKNTTKKYGIFTDRAKKHLELFLNGEGYSIEVAHQPKFLGGERFILNKIACGAAISNFDKNFFPFFYVADYDKVHSELTRTKFSQNDSSTGFSCSINPDIEKKFDGARIKDLPLPSEGYIDSLLLEIHEKYKNSINSCTDNNWHQQLYEERLEEALRLIKIAYHKSVSYTDWFVNIVGVISNVIYNYGYLFLSASDYEYKKLLTPVYENLLNNQRFYVDTYLDLYDKFTERGINPPLRYIKNDFVPFFYECTGKNCASRRLELNCEDYGSMIMVKCKCNKCGKLIDFSIDKKDPDLSEQVQYLTPRVESRQYLVSKTIESAIHIAGTGESRYYTMGIPLLRNFDKDVLLPVIYFYNKTTMNTFMTRKMEQGLVKLNLPEFLENLKGLMKNLGKFNKFAKKSEDFVPKREKIIEILKNIESYMIQLEEILVKFKSKNLTSEESNLISRYLGNLFGKISREKHGQEAAFNWVDLCLKNGLSDLLQDYQRIYRPWLPPGMEIFI
ncbi:MAG: bacillithiol biosynthesis protein BshC [Promethearchaeota archaeon]